MQTRRLLMAAVVVMSGLGAGVVASAAAGAGGKPVGPGPTAAGPLVTFSGHADGLFPGSHLQLPVTVTNQQLSDTRVTGLRVTVGAASPTCPGTTITIPDWTGNVVVAAKTGTATISLPVAMPTTTGDECAAKQYPLTFVGDARPAAVPYP
jgi:hypothetical protein